jgi:hypothetical protein
MCMSTSYLRMANIMFIWWNPTDWGNPILQLCYHDVFLSTHVPVVIQMASRNGVRQYNNSIRETCTAVNVFAL